MRHSQRTTYEVGLHPSSFDRGPGSSCGNHYLLTLSSLGPDHIFDSKLLEFHLGLRPHGFMRLPFLWQSIRQSHSERRACLAQFQRSQCLWPSLRAGNRMVTSQGTRGTEGHKKGWARTALKTSSSSSDHAALSCTTWPRPACSSPTAPGVIWIPRLPDSSLWGPLPFQPQQAAQRLATGHAPFRRLSSP